MKTLAEELADENDRLRRRVIHATRPKGPLSMDDAADLSRRMSDNLPRCDCGHLFEICSHPNCW